ncbi:MULTISPECIES: PP0621 family protein [Campylobacter]|uniref:PP0621 family protein n=1 Tax=Campylobacter TaxID=194 RepID=UPI000A3406C9|nr:MULTISPECIES: PP0621 family protein [unclassified Campylobacter]MCR8678654.1 PP0621 family protein [Campylobacter sp. RM19072]MCR8696597.1 PP0621 family protein [Campylobacter sp. RM19073]
MLSKIIIFILIIAIIYFFIIPKFRGKKPRNDGDNFVECSKCDTFVELKDSVLKDGKYICKECLK